MAQLAKLQLYSCSNCRNNVALHDDIISKAFRAESGRAFLFSHVTNIDVGVKQDRELITGLHTIADISCNDCHEVLGWKYERAFVPSQKYKEGKFILEKAKIVKEDWKMSSHSTPYSSKKGEFMCDCNMRPIMYTTRNARRFLKCGARLCNYFRWIDPLVELNSTNSIGKLQEKNNQLEARIEDKDKQLGYLLCLVIVLVAEILFSKWFK